MNELKLGQEVKILATGIKGKINAIWQQVVGHTRYEVYYYDSTGRRAESWMISSELEAI